MTDYKGIDEVTLEFSLEEILKIVEK